MRRLLSFLWVFYNSSILSGATVAKVSPESISCVNDYLFTISCELRTSKDFGYTRNISYWLEFQRSDGEMFNCSLVKKLDSYYCNFKSPERFIDTEHFVIKLRNNQHNDVTFVDEKYKPVKHIKPIAPCNLTVQWISGVYYFTWHSGYEKIQPKVFLIKYLKYKLWYYKSGYPDNVVEILPFENQLQVDDVRFEPDTDYIAQVSSCPQQLGYFGVWSTWSPTVRWKTSKHEGTPLSVGLLLVAAFVSAGMMLLLCFSLKARSNIKAYFSIPTPEPFFQTLYSNYKGNFKSWVVSQGNLEGKLHMEELLKIDTLVVATPVKHKDNVILPPVDHNQSHAMYVIPSCNTCGICLQESQLSTAILGHEPSTLPQQEAGTWKDGSEFGDLQDSTGYTHTYTYCTLVAACKDLVPISVHE